MASNRVQMAKEALAQLDEKISKLKTVRAAWQTILEVESELDSADPIPQNTPVVTRTLLSGETEVQNPDGTYGDKTVKMRQFVIQRNGKGIGVTRNDVVQEATRLGTASNYGYKFIQRMVERGELREHEGRFFPTEKMIEAQRESQ